LNLLSDLRVRPPEVGDPAAHPEGSALQQDLRVALADEVLLRPQATGSKDSDKAEVAVSHCSKFHTRACGIFIREQSF
jgi:hypothetical protein